MKLDDKINEISFFELDDKIFKEEEIEKFRNSQIYLIHHPNGPRSYSAGKIRNIALDTQKIEHSCDSSGGSSGGAIINKIVLKVLGIHIGGSYGKKYNFGIL